MTATSAGKLLRASRMLHADVAQRYVRASGKVSELHPAHVIATGLSRLAHLGEQVTICGPDRSYNGEILKIEPHKVTIKPYDERAVMRLGCEVRFDDDRTVAPNTSWFGRVLDAFAIPLDNGPPLQCGPAAVQIETVAASPLTRARVVTPLRTGIVAIDAFTPLCLGQRIGLFAGSGVGKSTLLAMLAKASGCDVTVVCLVGERGREVREFVEDTLGGAMANAVLVVATSDESALKRRLAPKTAMAIAEYFRDQGKNVLLLMDSITRFAHSCRDVAISTGEFPISRGFTPSTFSEIARLLERAGPGHDGHGSITGIFTVLLDGENTDEPVADAMRGSLDGHILLRRNIAQEGRFPAIDVLSSISRLANHAWTADERRVVSGLLAMVERYEDSREIRSIGGYKPGTDPQLDESLQLVPRLYRAINQSPEDGLADDAFATIAKHLSE